MRSHCLSSFQSRAKEPAFAKSVINAVCNVLPNRIQYLPTGGLFPLQFVVRESITAMFSLEGRRSNIQIVAEILRLLRLGEAGKTEVMYTVKLSYYQIQHYLNWLLELELVDKLATEGQMVNYGITRKGLQLLSNIENVQEMLHTEEASVVLHAPELIVSEKLFHRIFRRLRNAPRED